MSVVLGLNGKLYYDTAGVGVGSWVEATNVRNVTLNLGSVEADVTTRASGGWRWIKAALKEGSVEFQMVWDTDDAAFTAFRNAYFSNTAIGVAAMDGDIETSGSEGLWADFSVIEFSRDEQLEDAMLANVTIKPTYSSTAPAWHTIGGS